jgi:hypothetical protein
MIDAAAEVLVAAQAAKLEALREASLPIQSVERVGTTIFVTFLHPKNGRPYMLRYRCDGYPLRLPSTHFVDPETHEDTGPAVWPSDGEQAIKTSPNPRFICLPGTREYHESHGPVSGTPPSLAVVFQHVIQALELRG